MKRSPGVPAKGGRPWLSRESGFSIREAIIVAAVIAILVVLAYPVMGNIRERGRITECANNLKQIGAALNLYKTIYTRFPRASLVDFRPIADQIQDYSVFVCPGTDDSVMGGNDLNGSTSYRYFASLRDFCEIYGGIWGGWGLEPDWDANSGHGNENDLYDEDNPGQGDGSQKRIVIPVPATSFEPDTPARRWNGTYGAIYDRDYANHNGLVNMLFLDDGRIEQIRVDETWPLGSTGTAASTTIPQTAALTTSGDRNMVTGWGDRNVLDLWNKGNK